VGAEGRGGQLSRELRLGRASVGHREQALALRGGGENAEHDEALDVSPQGFPFGGPAPSQEPPPGGELGLCDGPLTKRRDRVGGRGRGGVKGAEGEE